MTDPERLSSTSSHGTTSWATHRQKRAPIDTTGARPPSDTEFATAVRVVDRSGVLELLCARLDSSVGRPRSLSVRGFLVAAAINELRRNHSGTVAGIARVLNSLLPWQRRELGIRDWDSKEAYDRTDRLFNRVAEALGGGPETAAGTAANVDGNWFINRLAQASTYDLPAASRSLAVDGTDIETWGRLQGDPDQAVPDAPHDDYGDGDDPVVGRRPAKKRLRGNRAKVLGIGPDGRKIYTKDPDARAGHRSATGSRVAGTYVGYELHLGVQVPDVAWTNGVDRLRFGPDVPSVIRNVALTPAGNHRAKAIVPELVGAKQKGQELDDVVWDRGYSQLRPETTSHPLNRARIGQTFRPHRHQRAAKPFSSDAVMSDGQLFTVHLPLDLRQPPELPGMDATPEQVARSERVFNRRARYRFTRHAGPDADGVTRWRCPFCSRLLRSRSLPETMRRSRSAPLHDLPPGTACCSGIMSVSAEELPYWQRISPGTTAWRKSMGRRQAAESANAGLKGGFVDVNRKFLRVFGLVKMTILLAFTIVGYNLDRIRSYLRREALQANPPRKTRAKRRTGTWADILGRNPSSSGRDPPRPERL